MEKSSREQVVCTTTTFLGLHVSVSLGSNSCQCSFVCMPLLLCLPLLILPLSYTMQCSFWCLFIVILIIHFVMLISTFIIITKHSSNENFVSLTIVTLMAVGNFFLGEGLTSIKQVWPQKWIKCFTFSSECGPSWEEKWRWF